MTRKSRSNYGNINLIDNIVHNNNNYHESRLKLSRNKNKMQFYFFKWCVYFFPWDTPYFSTNKKRKKKSP